MAYEKPSLPGIIEKGIRTFTICKVVRSLSNIPELITILTFFLAISMGQNLDCAAVVKPNNVPG